MDKSNSHAEDLGNGNAAVEYQSAWGCPIPHWVPPFGEHRKTCFEELRRRFNERLGPPCARRQA